MPGSITACNKAGRRRQSIAGRLATADDAQPHHGQRNQGERTRLGDARWRLRQGVEHDVVIAETIHRDPHLTVEHANAGESGIPAERIGHTVQLLHGIEIEQHLVRIRLGKARKGQS